MPWKGWSIPIRNPSELTYAHDEGESLIKKGIGRLPSQGPPLAWGKLRSAANVYGHHGDFIALYASTISRSASQGSA